MPKEAESIGVKAGWLPIFLEARTKDAEVAPGHIRIEAPGYNAAGMIVSREDQRLFLRTGPPLVRRRIVLV